MNYRRSPGRNSQKSAVSKSDIILYLNYILILLSVLLFIGSATGYFAELTSGYKEFLLTNLGKTTKWSGSYGPGWFAGLADDISSLASGPMIILFVIIIAIFLYLKKKKQKLKIFSIVVIGGGILETVIKTIFSTKPTYNFVKLLLYNDNPFPSGHAMMSIVFYFTIAYMISKNYNKIELNIYILITSILLTLLIGLSRIIEGAHTPNEVIGGWSLGIFWLCLCWLVMHFAGISIHEVRHHST
jgi:undecaprenyl-diphosphatase